MSTPANMPPAPFLRSLRRILDNECPSIVAWTPDGAAFEIHDVQALAKYVLPKYFKHANYSSFQRQLNYFRFRKWTRLQTEICTFSNPQFLRHAPELMCHIVRKKAKSAPPTGSASSSRPPLKTSYDTEIEPMAYPFQAAAVPASPMDVADYYLPGPDMSIYYQHSVVCDPLMTYGGSYFAFEQLTVAEPPAVAERTMAGDQDLPFEWLDVLYPSVEPMQSHADWY